MKRLLVRITLLFFLLIPANVLADTITQIHILYWPSISASRITIYSPQLADLSLGGGGDIHGMFTNVVSSLACLNAACTKISVDFDISGITLNNVPLGGTIYPHIYFSGTLDFTGTLFNNGQNFTGESFASGNLIGCIDPACSTQLFQLGTFPNMPVQSALFGVFDSNGKGTLEGAYFVNPEPTTLLLFAKMYFAPQQIWHTTGTQSWSIRSFRFAVNRERTDQ